MQYNSDIPWVEKYRPISFNNIVLDPNNKIIMNNIINNNSFPNILFYGPPGTGKTTTIINLIADYQKKKNEHNKELTIHLNASDERGIDIIRNHISQFVNSKTLFNKGTKFIILDEVDSMTKNAQQALKYLLQTTTTDVRFCLICNYISKIDEPLKNEFICVRFNQLPQNDIIQFMRTIVNKENIHIDQDAIYTIQSMYKSDIRSMINFLQLNQNFKLNEWNKNILNPSILNELHLMFCNKEEGKKIKSKIYSISEKYNIDKKHLLQCYFNHLIRFKMVKIDSPFIKILKQTIHCSNAYMEDVIHYLVTNIININIRPSPCDVSDLS